MYFERDVFLSPSEHQPLLSVELQSMRLDGDVFNIADGFVYADVPTCPETKALVVTLKNPARLAASGQSALWCVGLSPEPRIHTVSLCGGIRANHETLSKRRVRELAAVENGLQWVGTARMHDSKRAFVDLLRDPHVIQTDVTDTIIRVCRHDHRLCLEVQQLLRGMEHRPNAVRALRRLALAHSVDVVDGVDATHSVENTLEVNSVTHLEHKTTER